MRCCKSNRHSWDTLKCYSSFSLSQYSISIARSAIVNYLACKPLASQLGSQALGVDFRWIVDRLHSPLQRATRTVWRPWNSPASGVFQLVWCCRLVSSSACFIAISPKAPRISCLRFQSRSGEKRLWVRHEISVHVTPLFGGNQRRDWAF